MADPEDLAKLRRLAGENRDDSSYTDEDLATILARHVCAERTDPVTLEVIAEHPDLYGAAGEVWEEKASALLSADSAGPVVKTERTGDVSVTYEDRGGMGVRDLWAVGRRMARRSCNYRAGTRSVDLLPPNDLPRLALLDSYDAWYDAVMAERRGLSPLDEAVVNRPGTRD